ncbi:NUDIX domain-containing protein [Microvirga sp. BT688]|uniref:NUDIX hydrolase n=1 Tax=Microvirga sp. TaxID=1873136 RepID=UPI001685D656|nr:NUDIX domain-containing protein [Microvirga sp.]MBD2751221.1 NUDIX domain-containing protein [Microvirga sp.]
MTTVSLPLIRIVAVALLRDEQLLLVRKRGTERFILPGGKFEPNETALEVACRELHEELGIPLSPQALDFLGTFTAPAANEPGHDVLAIIFLARLPATLIPEPRAEIADLRFEPLTFPTSDLAPLVSRCVLPISQRLSSGVEA